MHALLLAHPMGPVRGLVLGGQVPPRVVMNHHIRRRQIQPGAARLQGNQKNLGSAVVKVLHHLRPLLLGRGALQGKAGDPGLLQPLPDSLQHGGELREHKHLVPVFHHTGAELQAGLQLAGNALVVGKAQMGIAANLPQLRQRRQDLQLILPSPK